MKPSTSKTLAIAIAASALLTAFAPQSKAEVIVREVYERPIFWHGERVVRYESHADRVYYREPVYVTTTPVYYHEHVYQGYHCNPAQYPVYNQYNYHAR